MVSPHTVSRDRKLPAAPEVIVMDFDGILVDRSLTRHEFFLRSFAIANYERSVDIEQKLRIPRFSVVSGPSKDGT